MDLDDLRDALDEAGDRTAVDIANARVEIAARARHRRRRRRTFASALVLAGVLGAIGSAFALSGNGPTNGPGIVTRSSNETRATPPPRHPSTPTAPTSSPSTTAPTSTAPTATAPRSTSPTLSPVPTTLPPATNPPSTLPTSGACTSSQLHFVLTRELQSVMTQPGAFFSLTNRSATSCTLDGYPQLALSDTSGHAVAEPMHQTGGYQINDPGPQRVAVAPGRTVYFGLDWSDVNQEQGGTSSGCAHVASARVLAPNTATWLTTTARLTSQLCPPWFSVTAIAPRNAFTIATP